MKKAIFLLNRFQPFYYNNVLHEVAAKFENVVLAINTETSHFVLIDNLTDVELIPF